MPVNIPAQAIIAIKRMGHFEGKFFGNSYFHKLNFFSDKVAKLQQNEYG